MVAGVVVIWASYDAGGMAMGAAELIVIRHGESMGNAAAAAAEAAAAEVITIDRRDADVDLSPTGVAQAQALGGGLQPILADGKPTLVYSSPYLRAIQTAQLSLEVAGAALPIRVDERLRDRELGVLDLLTWRGVQARYPIEAERRKWLGKYFHRPPGGESWADVALRLRSFLRDLTDIADGSRVVIFCHDAVVLLFRAVCEGLSEQQVLQIGASTPVLNVSITQLTVRPDHTWELVRFNDVRHLEHQGVQVTEHSGSPDVQPAH